MSRRARLHVRRAARCAILLALAGTVALFLALRALGARADEQLASAGATMLAYTRSAHVDGPRTLRLNGARLALVSGDTRDSVTSVLDAIHTRCRDHAAELPALGPPLRTQTARASTRGALLDGILRNDNSNAGYLACLDLGAERVPADALLGRVRAFIADRDLAAIGELRFIFARRTRDVTSYVALYSEGSLPLGEMFPASGDVPGADVAGIPRPPAARRCLHASQLGSVPVLVAYQSARAPDALRPSYLDALAAAAVGLQVVAPEPRGTSAVRSWILHRSESRTMLSIASDGRGGTLVVLVPLD